MTSEIANNGMDTHHDVATQMITFRENGTISSSFDGGNDWNLTMGTRQDSGGVPTYIIETSGETDGFVAVIEADGVVRGAIGIYDDGNPRKAENNRNLAMFFLVGALVASSALISRRKLQ